MSGMAREHPRLQGFAPHESPPPPDGGLDRPAARSSLGLDTLQGFPPRWLDTAFTAPPLMGLALPGASDRMSRPFRVLLPARLACLSRDCRPSWALTPRDLEQR
jgi:hypothetical protein